VTLLALVMLAPLGALAMLLAAAGLERWALGPVAAADDDPQGR
jgi:hypothetical protein